MDKRLYHQAILDAAKSRCGHGTLEHPDARIEVDNPLCGDRVGMELHLDGERIVRVAHQVRGCLLCEAGASIIGEQAPGESVAEVRALEPLLRQRLSGDSPQMLPWPSLEMFDPVKDFKSRHDCVLLPFHALRAALDQLAKNGD